MPRLFFAIPIAPALHKAIADIISQLKKQSDLPHIRWSSVENWHITVRFLGSVSDEKIDKCIAYAQSALQDIAPFEFTLGHLTVFPSAHPRMLAIQIPLDPALSELHRVMEEAMVAIGFKPESHAFFPHITLGKFQRPSLDSLDFFDSLKKVDVTQNQTEEVKEIALFSSETKPEGSVYKLVSQLILKPQAVKKM